MSDWTDDDEKAAELMRVCHDTHTWLVRVVRARRLVAEVREEMFNTGGEGEWSRKLREAERLLGE